MVFTIIKTGKPSHSTYKVLVLHDLFISVCIFKLHLFTVLIIIVPSVKTSLLKFHLISRKFTRLR